MPTALGIVFDHVEIGKLLFKLAMRIRIVLGRKMLNDIAAGIAEELELLGRFADSCSRAGQ